MLTLSLNGNNIPVPADFSMQLTFKSPMCDFEKIPSAYGLGITFPINEYTRSIFGNPERFSKSRTADDQVFSDFAVHFSGVLLISGTLKITNADSENYEASLIDQLGILGEKEKERSILDIPCFSVPIPFVNKSVYDPQTDQYCCFPLRNAGFFKDRGQIIKQSRMVPDKLNPSVEIKEEYEIELLSYLFNVYPDVFSQVNALNNDGTVQMNANYINIYAEVPGGKVNVVTPFFFLNHIIDMALKDSGLFLDSENYLKTHQALKNLVIYNNFDITNQTYSLLKPGDPWYLGPFLNEWENEGDLRSLGLGISYYDRNYTFSNALPIRHLPKMKVGDLLLSTQNLFNVVFHFLPNRTIKVYSREEILKQSATDLNQYFIGNWAIGEQKNVALKFCRKQDDKDMVFKERFNDLNDRKDDIKTGIRIYAWSELATKVPNPEPNEIRYIETEQKFVEYKWITQTVEDPNTKIQQSYDVLGWAEISIGFQDGWYEYGRDEVEEINSSWATTMKGSVNDIPHGFISYPEVNQPGNMSGWLSKTQEFSPRLLFYQPLQNKNSGGNMYYLDGNKPLTFEYEPTADTWYNCIFPTFWKYWNPFWANRLPITGTFNLPLNVLQFLILNICKKYRTDEGEFLIDELNFEIFTDHIGVAEVKGYKL